MPSPWLSAAAFLLLPTSISAVTLDCKHILVDKQPFDLHQLGGPKTVHWLRPQPPSLTNTTWTIDICNQLGKTPGVPKTHECPTGTRICGIEESFNLDDDVSEITKVIPIAGQYPHSNGRTLDPKITRLKDSSSHSDSGQEGLRVELFGGKWGEQRQKAIVEFICDPELSGNEGFEDAESMAAEMLYGDMRKEEGGEDDDGDEDLPELDAGKSLRFISYKTEGEEDMGVLRLTWMTRYACEGEADKEPEENGKTRGWGFFTWFLIVVFLLAASYIIFGSWLNYNRYGARGWDLIPHGDNIRDLPYIVKDWISGLVDRMKGSGGSRGGYSAV